MIRRVAAPLLGLAALALPRPAAAQSDEATMKDLLKESKSVASAEQELAGPAKEKLAAALGADFQADKDGKVVVWTAKDIANPIGDPEKLPTAWATLTTVGAAKVAVLAWRDAAEKNRLTIAGVYLLSPADAEEKLKPLLGEISGRAVTPNAYEPVATLEAKRAAAKAGGDKQTALLLSVLHDMHEISEAADAAGEAADAKDAAKTAKAAAKLQKEFEEVQKAFGEADFAVGGQKAALVKQVDAAAQSARDAKTAADAGNLSIAAKRVNDIKCGACHGSFKLPFIEKRAELKVGDGYFVPGHDLPEIEGDAAPLAKSVAAAARKALLILDQVAR